MENSGRESKNSWICQENECNKKVIVRMSARIFYVWRKRNEVLDGFNQVRNCDCA